nr:NAD(P)/FAD-dependent oxidoreductase [Synergistales bacterium]
DLRIAIIEKEMDVGLGTSCRNSGVIHSGINYLPGSLRAKVNVRGNELMDELCRDLRVKMKRIGKLTVAQDDKDVSTLHRLKEQGEANGVPGLKILGSEDMQKIQPGIRGLQALYSPTSGIVCPYGLTIGLAENAHDNGVHFHFGQEVSAIKRPEDGGFVIVTRAGTHLHTRILINAAGLFSDMICRMLGIDDYRIYPCRGEYYVLDRRLDGTIKTLIYPAPRVDDPGLGIHLTPTVDGNILVGPSAEYVRDHEDYSCSNEVMQTLRLEGRNLLPDLKMSDLIRSFSGVRPKLTPPEDGGNSDFIIEDREDIKGFINLVGIESPGLTSAPAIAEMVSVMVGTHLPMGKTPRFEPRRKGSPFFFSELPDDEKQELIAQNPNYGEIICRCEKITKQEILDA